MAFHPKQFDKFVYDSNPLLLIIFNAFFKSFSSNILFILSQYLLKIFLTLISLTLHIIFLYSSIVLDLTFIVYIIVFSHSCLVNNNA